MPSLNPNKKHFLSLKSKDDALFRNISKRPDLVLKPLKAMLNPVVDRISFQELEHEMERADLHDDYNFLKSDIVVTLPYLTHRFNLNKLLN